MRHLKIATILKNVDRNRAGKEDYLLNQRVIQFTDIEDTFLDVWLQLENANLDALAAKVINAGLLFEHYLSQLSNDPDQRTDAQDAQLETYQKDAQAALDEARAALALQKGAAIPPVIVAMPPLIEGPRPIDTTLTEIINAGFLSALDKKGTGGRLVHVTGLTVLSVESEKDGDSHITVTDGKVPVFITELTPEWKAKGLIDPPVGATIEITGYAFNDTHHASEAWHGNTGWEIHPITEWKQS